jgi:large subunit ribosomal protein L17
MRHNRDGRKLGRTSSHRRALMRNMVTSLFASERIETTTPKAKEVKRIAERMITFARRGDLSARRYVAKTVQNPDVLKKLFDEIAPRYVDRPGGYTRVLKLGRRRKGDNAQRAILELVGEKTEGRKKKKKQRKKYHKVDIPKSPAAAKKGKAKKKAEPEEAAAEEAPQQAGAAGEATDAGTPEVVAPAEKEKAPTDEPEGGKEK